MGIASFLAKLPDLSHENILSYGEGLDRVNAALFGESNKEKKK